MRINKTVTILLLVFSLTAGLSQAQTKPGYKLPQYEKFMLSNGLTVYLMEKHDVPVISLGAVLPAGAVYDGNMAGLASLTAACLKCGTKTYTKKQIEEQFDFVGASLDVYGTTEFAGLSSKFAVKDEQKILPVLKELLVYPTFPEEEFNKEKKRELVNLNQQKESPGSVINAYWNKFFYGNHVYGNVVEGTVTSVSTVTAADLKAFYKTYYDPAGSAIAVVGDFNAREMKATLTSLFADWKKSATASTNLSSQAINAPPVTRVLLVNKDDARETTLLIGSVGVSRNNPDYVPIQVVNTFFGGRFTSWINEELRIKSGLTYGAGSYFDAKSNNGVFLISTHTANETTEPTIDKALEVVNRLHTQPIDEETLTSSKNYMVGLFPPRYQTTDQLAGLLTGMFWFGYDESYINNFEANVNAVTVDKTKEIIAKYFPKDKLQFVLIGKSADIKKIAEKYGPVTEVQIKDDIGKGFDFLF
jgi:predicted Zn-dependent peptidase